MPAILDKLNPFRKYESRSVLTEVRGIGEEGEFEGYIVLWNQVDSYHTRFEKGSFAQTIKDDFRAMKVFYNHQDLIGKPLEMVEDEKGVRVRGKINLNTSAGKDAWEFIKDETVDGLSFRFRTTKPDGWESGVRVIKQVQVKEFGPVIYPAGDDSKITSIRAGTFDDVFDMKMVYRERMITIDALFDVLDAIYYQNAENAETQISDAIDQFKTQYLDWFSRYDFLTESQRSEVLAVNDLAYEFTEYEKHGGDTTMFEETEIDQLRSGELIAERSKLNKLPDRIRIAHQKLRSQVVSNLCSELRNSSGLTEFEIRQVDNLLQQHKAGDGDELDDIAALLKECRETFTNN